MAMVINTNIASLNSQMYLNQSQSALQTAMQRLSSGLRINSAADDAAGMAIADRMTSQINGMTVAQQNANDGISMVQTADSAMASISDTMQRMRDLAVQASNFASVSVTDRQKLNTEFSQLGSEVSRIIQNTQFNGKSILNGSLTHANFQIGANVTTDNQVSVTVSNLANTSGVSQVVNMAAGSGIIGSIGGGGSVGVRSVISALDGAIAKIDKFRSVLGATQNRFTTTVANLQSAVANQSAARSRIQDANFASETSNLSRAQILQQAGTAMLSQANSSNNSVLSLLK